jgi:predicted methyltransferase
MTLKGKLRGNADGPRRWKIATGGLPGRLAFSLLLLMLHPMASSLAGEQRTPEQAACRAAAKDAPKASAEAKTARSARESQHDESIRALLKHLGVGEGAVIADVGAGRGQYTWTFAEIAGKKGTVYAEEIVERLVKSLRQQAEKKELSQVRAVLGSDDDPMLPPDSVDLAFMRYVYHHLAKPRPMLRGIWRSLKPGGYLVVVDRHRGTLRDWVPRDQRSKKHFWIAETTVVREAREEGFAFVDCGEEYWHEGDPFVLIFRRPEKLKSPGHDPDPFLPLPVPECANLFLPVGRPSERPVFVALSQGRQLIAPILQSSSGQGLEIVLEEWATQKDERPPLPQNLSFPSVLTENGDPHLGPEPVDVVFFLDSYHLLFHGKTLLAKIHQALAPAGCVYVLDREAHKPLSRREASHRRMIRPQTVEQEMAEAGFHLWFHGPPPAADRFLLMFGKVPSGEIPPENDPFFGGPEIAQSPGPWLQQNRWRLRGLKTADGRLLPLPSQPTEGSVGPVRAAAPPGLEAWTIPGQKLVLYFQKTETGHRLVDFRSAPGR